MSFGMGRSPSKEKKFEGVSLDLRNEMMGSVLSSPQVKRSELYGTALRGKMAGAAAKEAGTQGARAQTAFGMGARQGDKMLQYLSARARGQGGPSAAETQLRDQSAAMQRANVAMAGRNKANPLAAMRSAAMANDTAGLETNQQARAVALQDQQNSQAMLAQYISDMRSQQQAMAGAQNQRQMDALGAARAGAQFYANRETENNLMNQRGEMGAIDRELDLNAARLANYEAQVRRWKRRRQDNQSAYTGAVQSLVGAIF